MEVLKGTRLGFTREPTSVYQKRTNIQTALSVLDRDKVVRTNIGSEDIYEGNQHITMGLIWILILNYDLLNQHVEINIEEGAAPLSHADLLKKATTRRTSITRRASIRDLMEVNKTRKKLRYQDLILNDLNLKLMPYGLKPIQNFNTDWKDGRALSALVDIFRPGFYLAMKNETPRVRVEKTLQSAEVIGIESFWRLVISSNWKIRDTITR
eukprot:sb/3470219/